MIISSGRPLFARVLDRVQTPQFQSIAPDQFDKRSRITSYGRGIAAPQFVIIDTSTMVMTSFGVICF